MLFSTSKYEKSKANVKLAKAKVEVLTLLLHSHWEVEHVPLMLCYKLEKLFSKWFSAIFTADLGLKWIVLVLNANWSNFVGLIAWNGRFLLWRNKFHLCFGGTSSTFASNIKKSKVEHVPQLLLFQMAKNVTFWHRIGIKNKFSFILVNFDM